MKHIILTPDDYNIPPSVLIPKLDIASPIALSTLAQFESIVCIARMNMPMAELCMLVLSAPTLYEDLGLSELYSLYALTPTALSENSMSLAWSAIRSTVVSFSSTDSPSLKELERKIKADDDQQQDRKLDYDLPPEGTEDQVDPEEEEEVDD